MTGPPSSVCIRITQEAFQNWDSEPQWNQESPWASLRWMIYGHLNLCSPQSPSCCSLPDSGTWQDGTGGPCWLLVNKTGEGWMMSESTSTSIAICQLDHLREKNNNITNHKEQKVGVTQRKKNQARDRKMEVYVSSMPHHLLESYFPGCWLTTPATVPQPSVAVLEQVPLVRRTGPLGRMCIHLCSGPRLH